MIYRYFWLIILPTFFGGSIFGQYTKAQAEEYFRNNEQYYREDAIAVGRKRSEIDSFLDSIRTVIIFNLTQNGDNSEQNAQNRFAVGGGSEANSPQGSNPVMGNGYASNCSNVDFEWGNFEYWTKFVGSYGSDFTAVGPNEFPNRIGLTSAGVDANSGYPMVAPNGGSYSVKLGNENTSGEKERLAYRFKVRADKPYFTYRYALVLEDPDHVPELQPYFDVKLYDQNGESVACSHVKYVASENMPGFTGDYVKIKNWTTNFLDLKDYVSQIVTIVFEVADCKAGGHFGYAYIDGSCFEDMGLTDFGCIGDTIFIDKTIYQSVDTSTSSVSVRFNGASSTSPPPVYYGIYQNDGDYKVTIDINNIDCPVHFEKELNIDNCEADSNCCPGTFAPIAGGTYFLSAWAKEMTDSSVSGYENPNILVKLRDGVNVDIGPFFPSGAIIDGWQRIEGKVEIPSGSTLMFLELLNNGDREVYFDDVRFIPFNSNMKSFVYDPITKRLTAQLDENNYSTFYEYDEEGKLIRIKKETERGIKTLQESRSNLVKKP